MSVNHNFIIKLNDLRFYAYHGLYPIEKQVGQWFIVNAEIRFSAHLITTLSDTVNYEFVYNIIKHQMTKPQELLETVLQNVVADINKLKLPIQSYKISLKKLNPLMGKEVSSTEVEIYS